MLRRFLQNPGGVIQGTLPGSFPFNWGVSRMNTENEVATLENTQNKTTDNETEKTFRICIEITVKVKVQE